MRSELHHAKSEQILDGFRPGEFDSCVTDGPYELGFMGQAWDRTGLVNQPSFWAKVFRVLKPGAHLLSFGGTRTSHRMVCAIEDSGFEIRDSIDWIYGQGFPKSKELGRGRGTALKPAHEPICLARKPVVGTVEQNAAFFGCGALNIDPCRVPINAGDDVGYWPGDHPQNAQGYPGFSGGFKQGGEKSPLGRWPANVIHDGSEEATEALGPGARFFYCAKPQPGEREAGLEHFAADTTDDGRHTPIDNPYLRGKTERRNTHPTVKPIALMRHLVRLVTPPGGLVLDPFLGSGTTGIGCALENLGFVGIDSTARFVEIARARIRHWEAQAAEAKESAA